MIELKIKGMCPRLAAMLRAKPKKDDAARPGGLPRARPCRIGRDSTSRNAARPVEQPAMTVALRSRPRRPGIEHNRLRFARIPHETKVRCVPSSERIEPDNKSRKTEAFEDIAQRKGRARRVGGVALRGGQSKMLDGKLRRSIEADKRPALLDKAAQVFHAGRRDAARKLCRVTTGGIALDDRFRALRGQNNHIERARRSPFVRAYKWFAKQLKYRYNRVHPRLSKPSALERPTQQHG